MNIVQIDYEKDGNIDHSMIVTKKIGNGNTQMYVTYSGEYDYPYTDQKDVPLSSVFSDNPNANYYAWQVKY